VVVTKRENMEGDDLESLMQEMEQARRIMNQHDFYVSPQTMLVVSQARYHDRPVVASLNWRLKEYHGNPYGWDLFAVHPHDRAKIRRNISRGVCLFDFSLAAQCSDVPVDPNFIPHPLEERLSHQEWLDIREELMMNANKYTMSVWIYCLAFCLTVLAILLSFNLPNYDTSTIVILVLLYVGPSVAVTQFFFFF